MRTKCYGLVEVFHGVTSLVTGLVQGVGLSLTAGN